MAKKRRAKQASGSPKKRRKVARAKPAPPPAVEDDEDDEAAFLDEGNSDGSPSDSSADEEPSKKDLDAANATMASSDDDAPALDPATDESSEEDLQDDFDVDEMSDMGGFKPAGEAGSDEEGSDSDLHPFEQEAMDEAAEGKRLEAANVEAHQAEVVGKEKYPLPSLKELRIEKKEPPDLTMLQGRIQDILEVLGNFRHLRVKGRSRKEYIVVFADAMRQVYGYNEELVDLFIELFGPMECYQFFEANEQPRPVVIRTNTLKTRRRDLIKALKARGVILEPLADWTNVGIKILSSNVPLGATPEYMAGQYLIQSPSSFMPVKALGIQTNERILDMASAPGGKTTHIAALQKNTGSVVACDINRKRLRAVNSNCHRMGVSNICCVEIDGRKSRKHFSEFDRVLLDAPCSCVGVIARDPGIKVAKKLEHVLNAAMLEKQLILEAIDSCKTRGTIVYSTCSVTAYENEDVVQYALRKRHVQIVETGLPFGVPGFKRFRHKKYHHDMPKTRRYYPHVHNMDGFFVAKFVKIKSGEKKKEKDEETEE